MIGALLCFALGVIADLIRMNRLIVEKQLELTKRIYLDEQAKK